MNGELLSRRSFIRNAGITLTGLAAFGCNSSSETHTTARPVILIANPAASTAEGYTDNWCNS